MATVLTIASSITVEPDACIQRTVEHSADVTRWPVEDRSSISDHVIVQPDAWSLDLVFSPQSAGDGRPHRAYTQLRDALLSRADIVLTTPYGTTTDLVCTSVSSPQDIGDGTSRRVSLRLEQARRATSQEVAVPVRRRTARLRTRSAEQDIGGLFIRSAQAAEIALSVVTLTPQAGAVAAAAQGAASLTARTSGALAEQTKSEVARILGLGSVSLIGGG